MVSISFDDSKWGKNLDDYLKIVQKIKRLTPIEVGCNLLIDQSMFINKGLSFAEIVEWLFESVQVDRVFTLYPKIHYFVDIIPFKHIYAALTIKYPNFYIDELTKKILEEGYEDWKTSCHYGSGPISIDEQGSVGGCSFEPHKVLNLQNPKDLLKIKEIKFEERFCCPFLKLN